MSQHKNETKFIFALTFLFSRAKIDKNETTFILELNQKERTFRMPKVTQEYIENKKRMIVEATYELCREKTVSTVTMQDIINRTGLSQGGIYRFYKDIDEILGDMLADILCGAASVNVVYSKNTPVHSRNAAKVRRCLGASLASSFRRSNSR